ncbi:39S ribosomal protein L18, mitochondrial [Chelonus insularis]|uniref:39S ribosomal protein L18, mitochondrial n=1 Tax=Chelonus insularis TaxID=460826 RepID=UPI00158903C9|nr:39S ribosomal protein L18, mitochondrial [Chelonus insularis]
MNKVPSRLLLANISRIQAHAVHNNAALLENCQHINNRNPRNLELMRIALKPTGYFLEQHIPSYWHKFTIDSSAKNTTFEVIHFENGKVLDVSTKEWTIKKRLYRCTDTSTYLNLGRILAKRCIESGIHFLYVDPKLNQCEKLTAALNQIEEGGIVLEEPSRYVKPNRWDNLRPEKPWEVIES